MPQLIFLHFFFPSTPTHCKCYGFFLVQQVWVWPPALTFSGPLPMPSTLMSYWFQNAPQVHSPLSLLTGPLSCLSWMTSVPFELCSGHLFLYPPHPIPHPSIIHSAVSRGFHRHHSDGLASLGIYSKTQTPGHDPSALPDLALPL